MIEGKMIGYWERCCPERFYDRMFLFPLNKKWYHEVYLGMPVTYSEIELVTKKFELVPIKEN